MNVAMTLLKFAYGRSLTTSLASPASTTWPPGSDANSSSVAHRASATAVASSRSVGIAHIESAPGAYAMISSPPWMSTLAPVM